MCAPSGISSSGSRISSGLGRGRANATCCRRESVFDFDAEGWRLTRVVGARGRACNLQSLPKYPHTLVPGEGWGGGAERPRLVHGLYRPRSVSQGRWPLRPKAGVYFTRFFQMVCRSYANVLLVVSVLDNSEQDTPFTAEAPWYGFTLLLTCYSYLGPCFFFFGDGDVHRLAA